MNNYTSQFLLIFFVLFTINPVSSVENFQITNNLSHTLTLSQIIPTTINISWEGNNLEIKDVKFNQELIDSINLDFGVPIMLKTSQNLVSNDSFTFTIIAPKFYCDKTNVEPKLRINSNCMEQKIYQIPIIIEVQENGNLITQSEILTIDTRLIIEPKEVIIPLLLSIIILGIIGLFFARKKGKIKRNPSKKQVQKAQTSRPKPKPHKK